MRAGINQAACQIGIALQHFRQRVAGKHLHRARGITDGVAVLVIGDDFAVDEVIDRSRATTLTIAKELDQHGRSPLRAFCANASDNALSTPTRPAATAIASMLATSPCASAVFSQRAI